MKDNPATQAYNQNMVCALSVTALRGGCVCVCVCVCFTILQGAEKIELPIEKDRTHPGILLGLPSFIS